MSVTEASPCLSVKANYQAKTTRSQAVARIANRTASHKTI